MYIPEIPNNSLTEEIKEIVELSKKLKDDYNFEYNPPATEEEIISWENEHKIKIPESLKDWLRFSNGYNILFERLSNLDNYIIEHKDFPKDLIIIGFTHDDSLCFSESTHEIVRYDYNETRRYTDFKAFLNETFIRSLRKSI